MPIAPKRNGYLQKTNSFAFRRARSVENVSESFTTMDTDSKLIILPLRVIKNPGSSGSD